MSARRFFACLFFVWLIEFLCYTQNVDVYQHIWDSWSNRLHIWGVQEAAATFLEAIGPLTILGAQLVYISGPLLQRSVSTEKLHALAEILEEPDHTKEFISLLRR